MDLICRRFGPLLIQLDQAGAALGPLALRWLLAWEFWESGVEKFHGDNWFGEVSAGFLFPFNLLPADVSWLLATWFELIGAAAMVVGLGTRFFSAALAVITLVAIDSVHAGHGYNVCDNGWKLPLIYLVMLVPLLLSGAGRWSLDHILAGRFACRG